MYNEPKIGEGYSYNPPPHYYGDIVRKLFIASAAVMIFFLPFIKDELGWPVFLSVCAVFILGLAAGFTTPRRLDMSFYNVVISLAGLLMFEFEAIVAYGKDNYSFLLFWGSQLLAILFLFALYFSAKTFRWMRGGDKYQ